MSESLFLYLKLRQEPFESFPWYVGGNRKEGGKHRRNSAEHHLEKRRWNYLFRNLPYESREMEVLGRKGLEILLPFTKEQLAGREKEVLSDILYRLQIETQVSYIAAEETLEKLLPFEWVSHGKNIPLFLIESILDAIGVQENISKKKMHIVILAGDDIYAGYLLDELGKSYNYISLVSKSKDPYLEQFDRLYDEYGLAVSFWEVASKRQPAKALVGDIFIDLTGKENLYYRMLPQNAIVLDLLGDKDLSYYQAKREDVRVYNSFSFGLGQDSRKEISNGLIQAALCQESSWLMKGALAEHGQLVKDLNLKLFSMKARFS